MATEQAIFSKIKSFLIATILITSSTFFLVVPRGTAHAAGQNWSDPWSDPANTNYNPQSQITEANIASLGVSWIFPLPIAYNSKGDLGPQGPGAPPLIRNGILYQATNQHEIYAFDAATGKVFWHYVPASLRGFQNHAIRYYKGMIWEGVQDAKGYNDVIAIDALTGDLKVNISAFDANIPGQRYTAAAPFYGKTYPNTFYSSNWPPAFYKNIALVQTATAD